MGGPPRAARGRALGPRHARALALALAVLGASAADRPGKWDADEFVDPDTPKEAREITVRGTKYRLVFSDEFEVEGRTFHDGDDPKWTGLNGPIFSNMQYNAYNSTLARTEAGKLKLTVNQNDWTAPYDKDLKRTYQSAMIQSWNKFCFTEGYIELSAQMPGKSDIGGTWPAFWMMGNLGRATFKESTDNVWPFNFDQCPANKNHDANQFGTQLLNKCDELEGFEHGRGAPEIDIVEVMPGDFTFDYQFRIDSGECPPIDNVTMQLIATKQPLISTSVQLGPGQHPDAMERPKLGCLPAEFVHPGDGSTRMQYYDEVFPRPENYGPEGPIYGTEYDVAINYWFWGDEYFPNGKRLHTDALSANTMLSPTHFESQHKYQCEWRTGDDGFVHYTLDDKMQYHVPASIITKPRPMTFDDPVTGELVDEGTLLPRKMPDEAMYLILNIDLGPLWGWADCPDHCDCCTDCKRSECTTCLVEKEDGRVVNDREWLARLCAELPEDYEIDYVRVYQRDEDGSGGGVKVDCDPDDLPTADYIEKHQERYVAWGDGDKVWEEGALREAIKPVIAGGHACDPDRPRGSTCGEHGSCARVPPAEKGAAETGVCRCEAGWTGPKCLVPAVGWPRVCAPLAEGYVNTTELGLLEPVNEARRCKVLVNHSYAELQELIEAQCALLEGSVAEAACVDVRRGGRYHGCTIRQRANHVLQAWAIDIAGGRECCNTLIRTGQCESRYPLSWLLAVVFALVLWAVLLVLCCRTRNERAKAARLAELKRQQQLRKASRAEAAAAAAAEAAAADGAADGAAAAATAEQRHSRGSRTSAAAASARHSRHGGRSKADKRRGFLGWRVAARAVVRLTGGAARAKSAKAAGAAPYGVPGSAASAAVVLVNACRTRVKISRSARAELRAHFAQLQCLFGFQRPSVVAQHEHLLQLWASHTSSCGDENLAAEQLHLLMFESFERWLDTSAGLWSFERKKKVVFVKYRTPSHTQRLHEMALYLCLWAEAGNLRFCPEILCFFFECARHHAQDALLPVAGALHASSSNALVVDELSGGGGLLHTASAAALGASGGGGGARRGSRGGCSCHGALHASGSACSCGGSSRRGSSQHDDAGRSRRSSAKLTQLRHNALSGGASPSIGHSPEQAGRFGALDATPSARVAKGPAPDSRPARKSDFIRRARVSFHGLKERGHQTARTARTTTRLEGLGSIASGRPGEQYRALLPTEGETQRERAEARVAGQQKAGAPKHEGRRASHDHSASSSALKPKMARGSLTGAVVSARRKRERDALRERRLQAVGSLQSAAAAEPGAGDGGAWVRVMRLNALGDVQDLASRSALQLMHAADSASDSSSDDEAGGGARVGVGGGAGSPSSGGAGGEHARARQWAHDAVSELRKLASSTHTPVEQAEWDRAWALISIAELRALDEDQAPWEKPGGPWDRAVERCFEELADVARQEGGTRALSDVIAARARARAELQRLVDDKYAFEGERQWARDCLSHLAYLGVTDAEQSFENGSDWGGESGRESTADERENPSAGKIDDDWGYEDEDAGPLEEAVDAGANARAARRAELATLLADLEEAAVAEAKSGDADDGRWLINKRASALARLREMTQREMLMGERRRNRTLRAIADLNSLSDARARSAAAPAWQARKISEALDGLRSLASADNDAKESEKWEAAWADGMRVLKRVAESGLPGGGVAGAAGVPHAEAVWLEQWSSAMERLAEGDDDDAAYEDDGEDAVAAYDAQAWERSRRLAVLDELQQAAALELGGTWGLPGVGLELLGGAAAEPAGLAGRMGRSSEAKVDMVPAYAESVASTPAASARAGGSGGGGAGWGVCGSPDTALSRAPIPPIPQLQLAALQHVRNAQEVSRAAQSDPAASKAPSAPSGRSKRFSRKSGFEGDVHRSLSGGHTPAGDDVLRGRVARHNVLAVLGGAASSAPAPPEAPAGALMRAESSTAQLAPHNARRTKMTSSDEMWAEFGKRSGCTPEGNYLRDYVIPLYRHMFGAMFSGLGPDGRPVDRPLAPGEKALYNYDDWNELVWTPKGVRRVVTMTGEPVLDAPSSERWAALARVDWERTMKGCKVHIECHSWHNVIAGYARIAIYHFVAFYALVLIALRIYATGAWVRPSSSLFLWGGFLMPSFVQITADACKSEVKASHTALTVLLEYDKTLPYAIQFVLFGMLAANWPRPDEPLLVGTFLLVSAFIVVRTTMVPRSVRRKLAQFDANVYTPRRTALGLVLFWVLVFSAKCAMETTVLLRAVAIGTALLEEAQPLQPFLERSLYAELHTSRVLFSRTMQQAVVWMAAFLPHCASTYFWYVLGVCVYGTARGLWILKLEGPNGAAKAVPLRRMCDLPAAAVAQLFAIDTPSSPDVYKRLFEPMHPVLERKFAKVWNAIVVALFDGDHLTVEELRRLRYEDVKADEVLMDGMVVDKDTGERMPATSPTRPELLQSSARVPADHLLPESSEARRRLTYWMRTLAMPMPQPQPLEAVPAFTVLIPHYSETIILSEDELFTKVADAAKVRGARSAGAALSDEPEPLIALLIEYFPDELDCFRSRLGERRWHRIWEAAAARLEDGGEYEAAELARIAQQSTRLTEKQRADLNHGVLASARKSRAGAAGGARRSGADAETPGTRRRLGPSLSTGASAGPSPIARGRCGPASPKLRTSAASGAGAVEAPPAAQPGAPSAEPGRHTYRSETDQNSSFVDGRSATNTESHRSCESQLVTSPSRSSPLLPLPSADGSAEPKTPGPYVPQLPTVQGSPADAPLAAARLRRQIMPLRKWASMRTQTLYRTVRGMMQYEKAMHLLLAVQRPDLSHAQRIEVIKGKFQCIVSMQRYAHFDAEFLEATDMLLGEFPRLNIAFIDEELDESAVYGKRWYACLIDSSCRRAPNGRREPRIRVELPGHPILGDGKGDNQNVAMQFVRGRLVQTIDSNQEGYLEEALKICNALGEFELDPTGTRERISILGFREHVYSSLGTIAHFTASSEYVFGTLFQRTMDRPLISRQYYGHPDVMEKLTMMAQGGVSKATKGLNLSEDIFAGMDLMLRGGNVIHREYMQVGKGREMSFGGQLKFMSKLSRGCAEMSLTRQAYRMGTRLPFGRQLAFWYGHIAFYLTPVLMEISLWTFVFMLLYFVLCDAELRPPPPEYVGPTVVDGQGEGQQRTYALVASFVLEAQFGPICLLWVLAQALPLFFEEALEKGILTGAWALVSQLLTFSWAFFTFQAQWIGYSYRKEISSGGAQYMATGRGIQTARQPYHEQFRAYAHANLQPAAELFTLLAMTLCSRPQVLPRFPFWFSVSVLVGSWLYAPFIFNPTGFGLREVLRDDWGGFGRWVLASERAGWLAWERHALDDVAKRGAWSFAQPGRYTIATVLLLALAKEMLLSTTHEHALANSMSADNFVSPSSAASELDNRARSTAARWDLLELFLFIVPLLQCLIVGGLVAGLRACSGQHTRSREPKFYVLSAFLLLALHVGAVVVYALFGSFVRLSGWAATRVLRQEQVVLLLALQYAALHMMTSTMAWLAGTRESDARAGRVERVFRTVLRDTAMAYWLLADVAVTLIVLIPTLAISLIPGITYLHKLLLFRVNAKKGSQVEARTAKLTRARKGNNASIVDEIYALRSRRASDAEDEMHVPGVGLGRSNRPSRPSSSHNRSTRPSLVGLMLGGRRVANTRDSGEGRGLLNAPPDSAPQTPSRVPDTPDSSAPMMTAARGTPNPAFVRERKDSLASATTLHTPVAAGYARSGGVVEAQSSREDDFTTRRSHGSAFSGWSFWSESASARATRLAKLQELRESNASGADAGGADAADTASKEPTPSPMYGANVSRAPSMAAAETARSFLSYLSLGSGRSSMRSDGGPPGGSSRNSTRPPTSELPELPAFGAARPPPVAPADAKRRSTTSTSSTGEGSSGSMGTPTPAPQPNGGRIGEIRMPPALEASPTSPEHDERRAAGPRSPAPSLAMASTAPGTPAPGSTAPGTDRSRDRSARARDDGHDADDEAQPTREDSSEFRA